MKKNLLFFPVALLVVLICSCASPPDQPPSDWRYEPGAIQLNLKADSQLNLYEGKPHTLLLCVYQLRDPNAFNQLTQDEDGLYKLLECSQFDPAVVGSKRLIIRPEETLSMALDRAEGAKYVALAAGYYLVNKEGMVRLYDVPWVVETKGFISKTRESKPAPLTIDLVLGSEQIQKFGGN